MNIIEAIHARRSIRDYEPRPVPRATIAEIVHDAAQAPTAPISGERPFVFVVIEGIECVAACGARALHHAKNNRPPGPGYAWLDRPDFSVFFNAPAVIAICGFRDGLGQAVQDCNRAGQNLMLSALARGLGTCWLGSPMQCVRDAATRAELDIPDAYDPFAVFTLGYPAAVPEKASRAMPQIVWTH